jgi:multidrug resistance efflux pump
MLLAACGAIGAGQSATPTPGAPPLEEKPALLRVEGRIVPHKYVKLATLASGQVSEILVHEGEQVQAGAVILRLGDREQYQADIAAAELSLVTAQQELEELDKNAGLELAQARQELALANQERSKVFDEYQNLSEPVPLDVLEQAYATVVAAERRLEKANDNLEYYQKRYRNKKNILWDFLNKRQFEDLLLNLEIDRDSAQKRYYDVLDRYEDLKNHPDEIALAQATADLALVDARIAEIQRDIALLEKGPDPDKVASAEARSKAAQIALEAAKMALTNSEILAPFSGKIADLSVTEGEWLEANQPVVVLADLSQWEIQTDDLTELDVPTVRLGQAVTVRPDALPELALNGVVETIKDLSEEKRGDVTYTVSILLGQSDPRLRWGMTVSVDFQE